MIFSFMNELKKRNNWCNGEKVDFPKLTYRLENYKLYKDFFDATEKKSNQNGYFGAKEQKCF